MFSASLCYRGRAARERQREIERQRREKYTEEAERESENAHSKSALLHLFKLLSSKFHRNRVVSEVPAVLVASCHLVRAVAIS